MSNHDVYTGSMKRYRGYAWAQNGSRAFIMMIAKNKTHARQRYHECLKRYPTLSPSRNPKIEEDRPALPFFCRPGTLIDVDIYSNKTMTELAEFNSVAVWNERNVILYYQGLAEKTGTDARFTVMMRVDNERQAEEFGQAEKRYYECLSRHPDYHPSAEANIEISEWSGKLIAGEFNPEEGIFPLRVVEEMELYNSALI